MSRHNNQAKALLDAWEVLLRHRRRFILPAFVVTAGVLGASMLLPRKYKAEAVFERRTDMVLAEIIHRGAPDSFQDPKQSLEQELAGNPAMEQLFSMLRESRDPRVREAMRDWDWDEFEAQIARKTSVSYDISASQLDRVRVSLIHEDAHLARTVVNVLVQNYIDRTRSQIDARLRHTAGFFRSEVQRAHEQIEQIEDRKLDFEIKHGEMLPDRPDGIQLMLADAQSQLMMLQHQRQGALVRVQELQKMLEQTPRTVPEVVTAPNPEVARMEQKVRQLRDQIELYTGAYKMTPDHPDLVLLGEQVRGLQEEIAKAPKEIVISTQVRMNHKYQELELRVATANTEVASLEEQIAAVRGHVEQLDAESAKLLPIRSGYRKLQRESEEAQRQLAFWEDNLRRVEMALTAESGDRGIRMDFIQPCGVIRKPVSPNLAQVLAAAMALGLTSGGLSVFFAHRIDETYYGGGEVAESLNLPLFGTVSEIVSKKEQRARRFRRRVVYPINAAAMLATLGAMAGLLYLNLEKPREFAEFRRSPAQFLLRSMLDAEQVPPRLSEE